MRHRRIQLAILLGLLAIALVWRLPLGGGEPVYRGRPLTFWVGNFSSSEGREGVRQIGVKGVPTLLRLIQMQNSYGRMILIKGQRYPILSRFLPPVLPCEIYHENAGSAFVLLGSDAKEAIPRLAQLINDRDVSVRYQAARALSGIGTEESILPIIRACTNDCRKVRVFAILMAGWEGRVARETKTNEWEFCQKHAREIVLPLIQCLDDKDAEVRRNTVQSLSYFRLLPEEVVPVLIKKLRDTKNSDAFRREIAEGLGRFGTQAKTALPALQQMLKSYEQANCQAASRAMQSIQSEVTTY